MYCSNEVFCSRADTSAMNPSLPIPQPRTYRERHVRFGNNTLFAKAISLGIRLQTCIESFVSYVRTYCRYLDYRHCIIRMILWMHSLPIYCLGHLTFSFLSISLYIKRLSTATFSFGIRIRKREFTRELRLFPIHRRSHDTKERHGFNKDLDTVRLHGNILRRHFGRVIERVRESVAAASFDTQTNANRTVGSIVPRQQFLNAHGRGGGNEEGILRFQCHASARFFFLFLGGGSRCRSCTCCSWLRRSRATVRSRRRRRWERERFFFVRHRCRRKGTTRSSRSCCGNEQWLLLLLLLLLRQCSGRSGTSRHQQSCGCCGATTTRCSY
jgi:hypothetical protein